MTSSYFRPLQQNLKLTGPYGKQSTLSPQLHIIMQPCNASSQCVLWHCHLFVINGGEASLCCLNSCRVLSASGWTGTSCCAGDTPRCACHGPLCRPSYGPSQYQSGSSVALHVLEGLGAVDGGLLLAATLAGLTGIQAGRVPVLLLLLRLALRLAGGLTAVL